MHEMSFMQSRNHFAKQCMNYKGSRYPRSCKKADSPDPVAFFSCSCFSRLRASKLCSPLEFLVRGFKRAGFEDAMGEEVAMSEEVVVPVLRSAALSGSMGNIVDALGGPALVWG